MLYNSAHSVWSVAQYKDYRYFYTEKDKFFIHPLDCPINLIASNLMPIGPTILVEWKE